MEAGRQATAWSNTASVLLDSRRLCCYVHAVALPPPWGERVVVSEDAAAVPTSRRRLAALGGAALAAALPRPTRAEPLPAAWTVMVYMSGDNNLESLVTKDFERELAAVGSTPAVQVVALADRKPGRDHGRGNWTGTKLFRVEQGMTATADNAVEAWGERDMGNPKTLVRFVDWAKSHCPADRYALYLWGHSWSWHPQVTMWDGTEKDALSAAELKRAAASLAPLDVVGYDSCNAGAIEAETLWRGSAQAIAHSQEWVNTDGFDYGHILRALNDRPGMTADDLAAVSAQSAEGLERTWSAVALDQRFDDLLAAVDQWAGLLLDGLKVHRKAYDRALKGTQRFVDAPMDRDLADFAANIATTVDDAAIRAASEAVAAAVGNAVLWEWHRDTYPGAHGITIYLPPKLPKKGWRAYRGLDFAAETRWDDFLRAYVGK